MNFLKLYGNVVNWCF